MDDIRELTGEPIMISSGYRCPEHNVEAKGTPDSQHLKGTACDFYAENVDTETLARYAEECGADGVGRYPTWVHADVRSGRVYDQYRW